MKLLAFILVLVLTATTVGVIMDICDKGTISISMHDLPGENHPESDTSESGEYDFEEKKPFHLLEFQMQKSKKRQSIKPSFDYIVGHVMDTPHPPPKK